MPIKPGQLRSLSTWSRRSVENIYDRIETGDILAEKDVGLIGYSWDCVRLKDVAKIFHCTEKTVHKWCESGLPRRPDNFFDLYQVILWYKDKGPGSTGKKPETTETGEVDESALSLKERKTQKEIEKLELQGQKLNFEMEELKKNTVSKDLHERTKKTIIESFVNFLINSLKRNLATIRAIPDSEVNTELDQLAIQLTRHMVTTARQAERD